jgi:Ca2+-binding EF-hand superfamily protein
MQYFDTDGSGSIDRNELNEGFKMMKVTLNEVLIGNVFKILDSSGDGNISLDEFEAVFEKYLGTGGPVQDVKAEDLVNENIDEETAIDLAK